MEKNPPLQPNISFSNCFLNSKQTLFLCQNTVIYLNSNFSSSINKKPINKQRDNLYQIAYYCLLTHWCSFSGFLNFRSNKNCFFSISQLLVTINVAFPNYCEKYPKE